MTKKKIRLLTIIAGLIAIVLFFSVGLGITSLDWLSLPSTTPTAGPTKPGFLPTGVEPNWTPVYDEKNGIPMVYVPAGCFMMGSEEGDDDEKVHEVCLSDFWIGKTEVTNDQYRVCVDAGVCDPPRKTKKWMPCPDWNDANLAAHPVVCISWHDATDYAQWLGGTLPTEAQWEYAARGPMSRVYPWGNEFDGSLMNLCDINCEYYWRNEDLDDGYTSTAPVGQYPDGASWVGAMDMAGNVWEWVADWYSDEYYGALKSGALNPTGPAEGFYRVIRGGSFYNKKEFGFFASYRPQSTTVPESYNYTTGFRVVVHSIGMSNDTLDVR